MGINCPAVCKVIHFPSPCTLLNFGMCLSKFKKNFKYQSESCKLQKMNLYATNAPECRCVVLLNHLDGEADAKREIENSNVARHNSCGICTSACVHVNVRIAFLLKKWI